MMEVSIYPYTDKTVALLDEMLRLFRGGTMPKTEVFTNLKNRSIGSDHNNYYEILMVDGYIKDTNGVGRLLQVGVDFLAQGGYKAAKERFEEQLVLKKEDRELLRKLQSFQVEEYESKLKNLEETLAKQEEEYNQRSEFWTTSAKRNNVQTVYFVIALIIALGSIGLSIYAVVRG